MELDSVRELKQSLIVSAVRAVEGAAGPRHFGVAASRRSSAPIRRGAIALGASLKRGADFSLAVRVQQQGLEKSDLVENIRTKARGEVDVRYVGRVSKRATPWHQRQNRPLLIGGCIGHFKITAGTLGCFVRTVAGKVMILSNNHVLANENAARKGDAILQPGPDDGGSKPGSVVAKLHAFITLKRRGTNLLDCAVAILEDGLSFDPRTLRGLGKLSGTAELTPDSIRVAKVGRTTGKTRGRITAFELDNLVVSYDIGNLRFDNQIEIEGSGDRSFSDGGDSGSVIVNPDGKAVALLFAGSEEGGRNGKGLTYATPLHAVLSTLGVTLVF